MLVACDFLVIIVYLLTYHVLLLSLKADTHLPFYEKHKAELT